VVRASSTAFDPCFDQLVLRKRRLPAAELSPPPVLKACIYKKR
jgi:hypothetical protein